ncbi:MAG: hypothetical protein P8Y47_01090 [Alphaproteobacteria bacterium]
MNPFATVDVTSKLAISKRRPRCFNGISFVAACSLVAVGQAALSNSAKSFPLIGKHDVQWLTSHHYDDASSMPDTLLRRVQMVSSDFMVMHVTGKTGKPLLFKIALPDNSKGNYRFLMFRGLPPGFSLSSGFAIKNQWAVSLNNIKDLMIIPPPDYSGSFNLEVRLMKDKGSVAESRIMKAEFKPAQPKSTVVTGAVQSQVLTSNNRIETAETTKTAEANVVSQQKTVKKKAPPTPREMTDEDRLMLERGDLLFRQGDVAAARLIYNRMAKRGIAAAALAMGRSYDPRVLKPMRVEGLRSNAQKARVWYKLAVDLGSQQAKNRLLTLRNVK